jgi:rubrerythrin
MKSNREKVLKLMEQCLNNEIRAVKKYSELAKQIKDERITKIIRTEKRHIASMNKIITLTDFLTSVEKFQGRKKSASEGMVEQ